VPERKTGIIRYDKNNKPWILVELADNPSEDKWEPQ
jgi:hypothetical protein